MTATLADSPTGELPTVPVDPAALGVDRESAWGLIDRAQAGGPGGAAAFAELYDRWFDRIYWYVRNRVYSRQHAEDVTQETFLRAWAKLNTVSWQGRDFGTWLYTIARNLIADWYKSSRCRLETVAPIGATADDWIGAVTFTGGRALQQPRRPDETAVASVIGEQLRVYVAQLGDEQREVIELRFFADLSVAETAQVTGKNEGAIKALQYRAVRTLAQRLPAGFLDTVRW